MSSTPNSIVESNCLSILVSQFRKLSMNLDNPEKSLVISIRIFLRHAGVGVLLQGFVLPLGEVGVLR